MPIRLLTLSVVLSTAAELHAEEPLPCAIQDTTAPAKEAEFFGAASGGSAVAKFTGVTLGLKLSEFPAELGAPARVRVETGDSKTPSIRVKGWANPGSFRYFARESVSLVGTQVRLTKGLEIVPLGMQNGNLTFEHPVLGTRGEDGNPVKLRGSIPCSKVALAPPGVDAADAPRGVRWYHMRASSLRVFDKPQGTQVVELRMDGHNGKVFFSADLPRSGWLYVTSPGDVTITGWIRSGDVELQPYAEVVNMQLLEPPPLRSPSLALAEPPKTLTATVELPILSKAEAGAPPLGVVEVGATIHGMDVSTEWTSVIPTSLAIMPVDGAGFWVKTASLPKP
ncbi:MAG: hypothetical protein FJ096_14460 [Deltaproteobacteria bacterium]|nr:hypothetical protein [Deltaproteobacteria bacterium]